MEAISTLIRISFPNYLKKLPVPQTFSGFTKLTGEQWTQLIPFIVAVLIVIYAVIKALFPSRLKPPMVNLNLEKENVKVVNVLDIEDLDKDKVSYCRCWRSSKFPFCDGSHNAHNEKTGDNVGPLVIRRSKKSKS